MLHHVYHVLRVCVIAGLVVYQGTGHPPGAGNGSSSGGSGGGVSGKGGQSGQASPGEQSVYSPPTDSELSNQPTGLG